MASLNPFDLLDDDAEDPSQIVAAKPLKVAAPVQPAKSGKMPTKPPPPAQAGKSYTRLDFDRFVSLVFDLVKLID